MAIYASDLVLCSRLSQCSAEQTTATEIPATANTVAPGNQSIMKCVSTKQPRESRMTASIPAVQLPLHLPLTV